MKTHSGDERTGPKTVEFVNFLEIDAPDLLDAGALARLEAQGRLGYADMYEAGVLPAQALADAIASFHSLRGVREDALGAGSELLESLSLRFLRTAWLCPFTEDGQIFIAAADPARTEEIEAVRLALGTDAEVRVASFDALSARFESLSSSQPGYEGVVVPADANPEAGDVERLQDLASGAPIVHALEGILETAMIWNATDIHVEPEREGARIRLRVDGVLRLHSQVSAETARGIISRVKILAGLNIAERRLPQDGRAHLMTGSRYIDVRVATAPTLHGEVLAIRLLVKEAHALDLSRLGMRPADLERYRAELFQPHGLIVVTGPTGSGKTTTLTAALSTLNTPDRKIMTIEDPVEYQIAGVNQTQVRPAIALTFAKALRSFLRHDPDILMIGEMRDSETASIGVQAALTGHLVLTTLHTNSAADALTRLLDLKVESFLLNAALRCIVGQRLVRKLCEHCRRPAPMPEEVAELIELGRIVPAGDAHFHDPVGCSQCNRTGYRGRVAIFEVLSLGPEIHGMIRSGAATDAIERAAVDQGMTLMLQDGYLKAGEGVTTFSEVLRATA